ncbi:hypothetical protein CRENPOLYSF1_440060 [Crenothrix polyspora]|uniref:Uncharacterized protein n=1 Tax=Crenothrix polyspora TaxID=360316 RepID=A0A1R4HBH4_9GAMM|nr:hypothetical protein CRENPOLYSF1_440060 [Crenothrix polyspora]
MAEGARLESVYTVTYRGFESPSLRQTPKTRKLLAWRVFLWLQSFRLALIL